MGKDLFFQEEKLLDIPVEELWELLADTNQLNKYIGLFPVQFMPFSFEQGRLLRHAEATAFGLVKMKWHEHVFEWIKNHYYSIERYYVSGPIERVLWCVTFEERERSQTLIRLDGTFTYRNIVGKVALKSVIFPQLHRTFQYALAFGKKRAEGSMRPEAKKLIHADKERLATLSGVLKKKFQDEKMIDRLVETIIQASDEEVTGIQPYRWAKKNGFGKKEAVELFLLANASGILDYEWSLMCPNCRVPEGQAAELGQLNATVHCDLCGVDYELNFDRYIEMRFSVHSSIRKASPAIYCINGPVNSPHILGQFRIPPQSEKKVDWPLPDQQLRFRVLKKNHFVEIKEDMEEAPAVLTYTEAGFSEPFANKSNVIPVANQTEEEIVLAIEKLEWDEFALTAREVTSLQLFRSLLPSEVLSPGLQIGGGHMAILFTDLKGSTQLYESIGDALAYSDVKKHFDYLTEHIRIHGGTVVKTIGDSVMAAFVQSKDAFHAALAVQQGIDELNKELTQPVQVKIGLHTGPVIAVNANGLLDYFGRTVNVAARIQQQSKGGDIVMSEPVYGDLLKAGVPASLPAEAFSRQLQGLSGQTDLVRIIV